MESQDTEITLGTGRLLGLFFALAILCAVFFGMGFTLGRNTGGPAPIITPAVTPTAQPSTAIKPAAAKSGAAAPCPEGQTCDKSSTDELAFIKTDAKPQDAAAAPPAETEEEPAPAATPATTAASKPAPEMKAPASLGSGFVVQIAAVSKKDDADALVGALRKKNYPVFVASDANDHLYHVQVGPFTDRKDAQTIKDKLAGDGYNAIVK